MITNFRETELQIMRAGKAADRSQIENIKGMLFEHKRVLDYIMSRFLDQFGPRLDVPRNDVYHQFVTSKNDEYAKITRLERVLHAYNVS
jgi:hypothetical protein